jgi:hypothetical protein
MVDSYSNSFRTAEHKLLAYPRSLIYSLSLSIRLRVIRRTKVLTGIHGFVQSFSELQNNLGFL